MRIAVAPKRIAFYAPLKPPTHVTPSGDRRVAGLLMDALELVAEHVELVSTFRSFDADGDTARQEALRSQGGVLAERFIKEWQAAPPELRPDLWFTYHVYYKAPDWLGPAGSGWRRNASCTCRRFSTLRLILPPQGNDTRIGPKSPRLTGSIRPRRGSRSRR